MDEQGSDVGTHALGDYVRQLRTARHLTRLEVAHQAGVVQDYVWKMEVGRVDKPSAHHVGVLVRVLGGNIEHAMNLLLGGDSEIDRIVARHVAAEWMELQERPPMPEAAEIQDIIARLADHPEKLHQWIGYGRGLLALPESG